MNDPFYAKGLCFSCKRCSHCCRIDPGCVCLSKSDLTNLCKWFNLKEAEFIRLFCRFVYNSQGKEVLSLKEKPDYDCILWDKGCTAYGARPLQCSTYPFWPFILESRQSWDKEAAYCPGINTGELHTAPAIEKNLALYRHNIPLTREDIRPFTEETEL
ncbi:YkgJ family cysteine cluster protein [Treponema sp. HNW]|uniref:YkgJ family cysteine cluster protein n=1 Tax=Treponema sp. HNW TaxID=3116654 RepID=UPI003D11F7E1